MTLPKKPKFEIINHGTYHAQYFQGCGVFGTKWTDFVTGCGDNAVEAYNDAVEQIFMKEAIKTAEWLKLPKKPRGINAKDKVPSINLKHEFNEIRYYVSIKYRDK